MISQASIKTYDSLCRASFNRELCVLPARLRATGEQVAMLAAVHSDAGKNVVTPFGMMCLERPLGADDALTPATEKKFKQLARLLRSQKHQPWFTPASDGKVSVAIVKDGVIPAPGDTLLVLAGSSPAELFADPSHFPPRVP